MLEKRIFGKRVSEYLAFQKVFLIVLVVVGLTRLALSLAGLPNSTVTWVSMNGVLWIATLCYAVAVHTTGFGSYKQLLPLLIFQIIPFHLIAVLGILLAIGGVPNIYDAPEYGIPNQWLHLLGHLTIGMVAAPLIGWAVASLVMLITKKAAPRRPAVA
jgi:hypothetical protein